MKAAYKGKDIDSMSKEELKDALLEMASLYQAAIYEFEDDVDFMFDTLFDNAGRG